MTKHHNKSQRVLRKLDVMSEDVCGVYMLKRRGRIIYIGHSGSIKIRIKSHVAFEFDDFSIVKTPFYGGRRQKLERALIVKHRPRHNKQPFCWKFYFDGKDYVTNPGK